MQAKHYTLRWLSNNPLVLMAGNDNEFTYSAILLLASLLGTFFDMRLFVLYVLFYFMRHNVLENVFKAITSNIRQLFSVSLLGLVFAYVFCLIFLERYAKETIGDVEDDPC